LLLKNEGLVKTVKFRNPVYVGDPINAVRLFNDLEADELCFLDITASLENRRVPLNVVRAIGDEAFMPFAVGGGIRTIEDVREILNAGAEKVVLNTSAVRNPELVSEAARIFGNQSVVVSIDVKQTWLKDDEVFIRDGSEKTPFDPVELARRMEALGAGEILLNSIDRDGTMQGYRTELIERVAGSVDVPVIAVGGAGKLEDFGAAVKSGAAAVAAGSMFVFHGPRRAVLINYPERCELEGLFCET